jgi:hypothetical protein
MEKDELRMKEVLLEYVKDMEFYYGYAIFDGGYWRLTTA